MELAPYTDDDLWLTRALETDPRVMAELGGPWPDEAIPRIHERRLESIAGGTWWFTLVPEAGGRPVGMLGIFGSEHRGHAISEAGWSVLPEHQQAIRQRRSRAAARASARRRALGRDPRLPGATNAASNALCRKFGFELVGQETVDYGGRALRCNHWVLAATERRPKRDLCRAAQFVVPWHRCVSNDTFKEVER